MQPINLAIIGLGTVGAGTLNLLQKNATEIARRTGRTIQITHVGIRRPHPDLNLEGIVQTDDLLAIARADNVDIVVEVIGGMTVAQDVILEAIRHGKHIVTANKALLAEKGNVIFAEAEKHHVEVRYEAAVAGGIPIIKVMREGLSANQIDWLAGIINGTGNFILTEMQEKGRAFADVLKEAQALGYAEADPTFDVEGIDAGHKLMLLASNAFGIPLQFDKVYTEGITQLSSEDVTFAHELGYRIKHLGIARRTEAGIELRVHPTLIPEKNLIANVNGVKNAVVVHGNAVGSTLYYGSGAGAGPTASAVVADIVDLVRSMTAKTETQLTPHLAFMPSEMNQSATALPIEQVTTGFYLKFMVADELGVLAQITEIMRDFGISIGAILQKPASEAKQVPVILIADPVLEATMNQAIEKIQALPAIEAPIVRIRVEELAG